MLLRFLMKRYGDEPMPRLRPKYCLNQRHTASKCQLCFDACAKGAVSLEPEFSVRSERCNGCGVCLTVCPSQALMLTKVSYSEVFRGIDEQAIPVLACSRANRRGNLPVPCIWGLSTEFLAALAIYAEEKPIWVDLRDCRGCSDDCGRAHSERIQADLDRLLQALNIKNPFVIVQEHSTDAIPDGQLSRQEFMRQIRSGSARLAKTVSDDVLRVEPKWKSPREWLLWALSSTDANGLIESNSVFTQFDVSADCDVCGFCQGICPQEAWKVAVEEQQSVLTHHPAHCTGCELCLTHCPKQAIQRARPDQGVPSQGLCHAKRTVAVKLCRRCRQPVPSSWTATLCSNCAKAQSIIVSQPHGREEAAAHE